MRVPQYMDGFYEGKSHLEMDDDWEYHHSWKPPCININMMVDEIDDWGL